MFPPNPDQKPEMMGIRKSGRKFKEFRKLDEVREYPASQYPNFFGYERAPSPALTPTGDEVTPKVHEFPAHRERSSSFTPKLENS